MEQFILRRKYQAYLKPLSDEQRMRVLGEIVSFGWSDDSNEFNAKTVQSYADGLETEIEKLIFSLIAEAIARENHNFNEKNKRG